MDETTAAFQKSFKSLLKRLGEDPDRPGLGKTPKRVIESLEDMTTGIREDIGKEMADAVFDDESGDMVLVRDIEFVSLCEHHMLPFIGHAHVGYVPDGRVIGLSKIARIVDHFSRRLQVQERMTREIADFIGDVTRPQGLGVVVTAVHMCMVARGIRKQDSEVLTSAWRGSLRSDPSIRNEFLLGIGKA